MHIMKIFQLWNEITLEELCVGVCVWFYMLSYGVQKKITQDGFIPYRLVGHKAP